MLNIATVIVTYNRLELLQEAIAAVKAQTCRSKHIVVINNGSTDETQSWLDQQEGLHTIHQENSGGSGGFYTGIKTAVELGAGWIWVMDDDTICEENTLARLTEKIPVVKDEIGFIGSKCIWKDGNPHLMNLPAIKPGFNGRTPFNKFDHLNLLLIETCSFVSLLINADAVKAVGLPYKEFFIWGDDQEYTRRISKYGYLGLYCIDSITVHKTPINYFPDFYNDTKKNLWKHKYGFRNEFFMVKKNKGFMFFIFWLTAKVCYTSYKIFSIRTSDRFKFVSVLIGSAWSSIFFNPKIDKL